MKIALGHANHSLLHWCFDIKIEIINIQHQSYSPIPPLVPSHFNDVICMTFSNLGSSAYLTKFDNHMLSGK
jgi:hypothetical protein